ncbi:MORC family CW-type zinc finger protein 4-like isoform 2-T14 [Ciconia maguari]
MTPLTTVLLVNALATTYRYTDLAKAALDLQGDNASHPSVTAKLFCIDVVELKGHLYLTFTDNGAGMTPHKLYCMLSFSFTEKTLKRDHPSIGLYGFKSGSMWLGKDAIIFTKTGGALSMALLSQTFMDRVHAETVIIPLVSFNQQNEQMIVTEDWRPSWSILSSTPGRSCWHSSMPFQAKRTCTSSSGTYAEMKMGSWSWILIWTSMIFG